MLTSKNEGNIHAKEIFKGALSTHIDSENKHQLPKTSYIRAKYAGIKKTRKTESREEPNFQVTNERSKSTNNALGVFADKKQSDKSESKHELHYNNIILNVNKKKPFKSNSKDHSEA